MLSCYRYTTAILPRHYRSRTGADTRRTEHTRPLKYKRAAGSVLPPPRERISLSGSQLSVDVSTLVVTYGPYTATDCEMLVPHAKATCLTASGGGVNHTWNVRVGEQSSDGVGGPTASYAAPRDPTNVRTPPQFGNIPPDSSRGWLTHGSRHAGRPPPTHQPIQRDTWVRPH